jgi:hypothetical protein
MWCSRRSLRTWRSTVSSVLAPRSVRCCRATSSSSCTRSGRPLRITMASVPIGGWLRAHASSRRSGLAVQASRQRRVWGWHSSLRLVARRMHAGTRQSPNDALGVTSGRARNASTLTRSAHRWRAWAEHRPLPLWVGRWQPATRHSFSPSRVALPDGSVTNTSSGTPACRNRASHRVHSTTPRVRIPASQSATAQAGRPSSGCSRAGARTWPTGSQPASAENSGRSTCRSRSSTSAAAAAPWPGCRAGASVVVTVAVPARAGGGSGPARRRCGAPRARDAGTARWR